MDALPPELRLVELCMAGTISSDSVAACTVQLDRLNRESKRRIEMHRTFIAACAASLISVGMPVLAQSTTPAAGQSSTTTAKSSDKDMTITGCLEKNKSGGFWLSEAESGSPSSSTTTAGTSGSAATTTGGSATTTGDKDMHRAMANHLWNLENGHDLDKYVNQKIQ